MGIKSKGKLIEAVIRDYFFNFFLTAGVNNSDDIIVVVGFRRLISDYMNNVLCVLYYEAEIYSGLNSFFFQKYWEVVGVDVSKVVLDILNG